MRIQVNARNRGYEFDARPGEKVLYAGLRAGIDLPYECGTGTCGTCKAKLIAGRVRDGWPAAPGRKHVKPEAGEFLMCQCAAEDALTTEVSKFVYAMEPGACSPDAGAGVLRGVRRLAEDVIAFNVELEQPRDFDAGQFVLLAAPGVPGYRAYSMCNFERRAQRLEFVIKRKPDGGFSRWLFEAGRDGIQLDLFGPLGKATFDPALGKNLLCIAGGSGIAGMMAILARAAAADYFDRHQAWVFFGVRTMKDAFFLRELSTAKAEITVALSEEDVPQGQEWPNLRFEKGLVHEVAKHAMAGRFQNVRAYVAGPPPAVDAAIRMLLLEAKLTTDNIRYDKFS
ncbi:MAG: 2Fe-2S iron-sulfur cluster binding domain-containing protein [Geminicoccales bacterium]